MTYITDVAIIGGGVIGGFIAYELAKAGLKTTVVEKGQVGAEASQASAGLLVPLNEAGQLPRPLVNFNLASVRRFPETIPELQQETGLDVEYVHDGGLMVAEDDVEAQSLLSQFKIWRNEWGLPLKWLDTQALLELEPQLNPNLCGGIFAEIHGSINSARLAFALARAVSLHSGQVLQGCLALDVRHSHNRVGTLITSDGEIAAKHLVIAAGAWSQPLVDRFGIDLPISPARGQMLSIKPLERLLHRPVLATTGGGISPKADGSIFVGSTTDLAGFNKQIRPEDTATLLNIAAALMPALRDGPIDKIWTGLRPYSEDGLPVIGKLPGWDNVFVATGHHSKGIMASAGTGKTIRDLIVDGQSDLLDEALSPARFIRK